MECNDECRNDAADHNRHLQFMRCTDGFCASKGGIECNDKSNDNNRQVKVPTQNGRENNGWCKNRNTSTKATLNEENKSSQQSRFEIKALFEKFIHCKHFHVYEPWDKDDTDNHHSNRQPEIKLNEAHAIIKSLAWCRKKCNCACLGGHYG